MRLITERLLLRDFELDDWPALHDVESRPEVARYQSFEPRTVAESRAYVAGACEEAKQETRETYDLAVTLVSEDRLIGRCGMGLTDPDLGEGMLWFTMHPSYWGRGYATEAARGLVDFGFRELRLHRIWADCDPANVASSRVLEKLGMRREGHLRENAWIKGAWADSLIYAILDREWTSSS
ncbi:MAG: GNAT family N-acetyltransferase [Chloroflexi bacterium]|nr:GNAT family N-acetyltransferase [Chloroflexota bacterium]